VHPEHVARAALESVDFVVAVGVDPAATLCWFCCVVGEDPPEMRAGHIDRGLAYFWERRERRLRRVHINEPRRHLRRHTRKYAEGDLDEDRSFYFRGPEGHLNLPGPHFSFHSPFPSNLNVKLEPFSTHSVQRWRLGIALS
jgi:hypothetical protein